MPTYLQFSSHLPNGLHFRSLWRGTHCACEGQRWTRSPQGIFTLIILPACDTLSIDKACLRISSSAVIFQTVGTFVVYEAPTVHVKVKGELNHHKVCKYTMSCINLATQHICPDTESLWSLLHLGPHVHIKGETTGHIDHIVSSLPPLRYLATWHFPHTDLISISTLPCCCFLADFLPPKTRLKTWLWWMYMILVT